MPGSSVTPSISCIMQSASISDEGLDTLRPGRFHGNRRARGIQCRRAPMILRRPRPSLLGLLLFSAAAAAAAQAAAKPFPSHAVTVVVPSYPGAATGSLARAFSARLSASWGQSVVVENRAGANQILGADFVSKSVFDGYTLLVS